MTIIEDAVRTMREAQIELARLREINAELLQACKRVMQLAVSVEGDEVFDQVKTAIAKAEEVRP